MEAVDKKGQHCGGCVVYQTETLSTKHVPNNSGLSNLQINFKPKFVRLTLSTLSPQDADVKLHQNGMFSALSFPSLFTVVQNNFECEGNNNEKLIR